MGLAKYAYNRSTSGGEIITHLINAKDGAGLHFDGAAGNIDIPGSGSAPVVALGTKFSFEFIAQADSTDTSAKLVDFGDGGRFTIEHNTTGLQVNSAGSWDTLQSPSMLADLKVHHLVLTVDGTAAILYDNGNQVGTADISAPDIDSCADARIGTYFDFATGECFEGTIYRARFWNKTLSQPEVTATYENATVPFADQYGSQTIVIPGDFDGNLDGWNASNTWNSQTNPSNNMVLAANATGQRCRTSTTLTDNKRYRVTYTATSTSGAPNFAYYDGGYSSFTPTNTGGSSTITNGTNTLEFIFPTTATLEYFYIHATTASDAVTLDDVSVVEIGCVADYDLAFANPTQSDQVQDRAGAADGTSSATGVTQVTKIEAVNTNKLNVGGVTPLVGIGLAAGVTPLRKIHINDAAEADILLTRTVADTSNILGSLYFGNQNIDQYLCCVQALQDGATDAGRLEFSTEATGGTRATRLTINSAGLASFSAGIAFSSQTNAAGMTATTLNHYEEGTWTVTAQNGVTLHAATDLGSYTRVGRLVTCGGQVQVDDDNSTADLIFNLPFPAAAAAGDNSNHYTCSVRIYDAAVPSSVLWAVGYVGPGTSNIYVVGNKDGAASVPFLATADGYYMFNVTYIAV